jgi:acetyl-CoA acetyltransferase
MREVVIVDAVRTPIGRYKGALKDVRPDDLGAVVIKALVDRNPNLPVDQIEEVILGNANQAGEDNRNVARMSALLAVFLLVSRVQRSTVYAGQDWML